jgi:hypothetical protein
MSSRSMMYIEGIQVWSPWSDDPAYEAFMRDPRHRNFLGYLGPSSKSRHDLQSVDRKTAINNFVDASKVGRPSSGVDRKEQQRLASKRYREQRKAAQCA